MRKRSYSADMPHKMYTYFIGYSESGAPSFDKFARSIGVTLSELEKFKSNKRFLHAWQECSEIRRDYLIDTALAKRADASFVKFLLLTEFGMGEEHTEEDSEGMRLILEVIE